MKKPTVGQRVVKVLRQLLSDLKKGGKHRVSKITFTREEIDSANPGFGVGDGAKTVYILEDGSRE